MPDLSSLLQEELAQLSESFRKYFDELRPSLSSTSGLVTKEKVAELLDQPSADPGLQALAAWVASVSKDKQFVPALTSLARNAPDDRVVWEATKALCSLGQTSAYFESMLAHGTSAVRAQAAAFALGQIKDTSSGTLLRKVLLSSEYPPSVRAQTAEALGYLQDDESLDALLESAGDNEPEVRYWSVFALGNLGNRQAIPKLKEISESDSGHVEGWGSISDEANSAIDTILKFGPQES